MTINQDMIARQALERIERTLRYGSGPAAVAAAYEIAKATLSPSPPIASDDEARAREVLLQTLAANVDQAQARMIRSGKLGFHTVAFESAVQAMLAFNRQPLGGDFVVVPREPTEAMLEAAYRHLPDSRMLAAYRAMLATAPDNDAKGEG